ncbi:MAG TPA: hypothetical protein VKG85_13295 [Actinomycetes bacterium]|nr:hypothetical protein [Actinomycetes bacterium]
MISVQRSVLSTDALRLDADDAGDVTKTIAPKSPATDAMTAGTVGYLGVPAATAAAQEMFDEDLAELGYVMNVSRLWAYQPATLAGLSALLRQVLSVDRLSPRQRSILVTACASAIGDSYCSLVWGSKLAAASDVQTATQVLAGADDGLSTSERVMARWARKIARDPNATTALDVQELREAGLNDSEIFTITVFVSLRLAFLTVNDALGLSPDAGLRFTAPPSVRNAVTFGRPIEEPV